MSQLKETKNISLLNCLLNLLSMKIFICPQLFVIHSAKKGDIGISVCQERGLEAESS